MHDVTPSPMRLIWLGYEKGCLCILMMGTVVPSPGPPINKPDGHLIGHGLSTLCTGARM